jgi:hypothetical protein
MHKLLVVAVVVLLLAISTAGFCQINLVGLYADSATARWMGMGCTGIAAANDEGALDFNPANLATMKLGKKCDPSATDWEGSLTWGDGSFNELSEKIGVVRPCDNWGAAVSYEHASGSAGAIPLSAAISPAAEYESGWTDNIFQAGYGHKISGTGLSVGASVLSWSGNLGEIVGDGVAPADDGRSFSGDTLTNLGVLYEFPMHNLPPLRVGAVWQNIFSQIAFTHTEVSPFDAGIAIPVCPGLTLAADALDVTKTYAPADSVGAEYCMKDGLSLRAGDYVGNFTAGAGYRKDNWRLDVAYDRDVDNYFSDNAAQWTVTGSVRF